MPRSFADSSSSAPLSTGTNWLHLCFYALTTSGSMCSAARMSAVTRAKNLLEHSLLDCSLAGCGVEGCAALKVLLRHYLACVDPACKVCQPVVATLQRPRNFSLQEVVRSSSRRSAVAVPADDAEAALAPDDDDDADFARQSSGAGAEAACDAEVHLLRESDATSSKARVVAEAEAEAEERVVVLAQLLLHSLMAKSSMDASVLGGEETRAVSGRTKQLWLHLLSGQCSRGARTDNSSTATPEAAAVASGDSSAASKAADVITARGSGAANVQPAIRVAAEAPECASADSKAALPAVEHTAPNHRSSNAPAGAAPAAAGVTAAPPERPGCCGSTSCLGARKVLRHLLACKEPSCRLCQRVRATFSPQSLRPGTTSAGTGTGAVDTAVAFQEDLHQPFSRLRT